MCVKEKEKIFGILKEKLPLVMSAGEVFDVYITSTMNDYIKLVSPVYKNDDKFESVMEFIRHIPCIYSEYVNGNISGAFDIFNLQIQKFVMEDPYGYNDILPICNRQYRDIQYTNAEQVDYYFRLTCFEENMIHVPFDKIQYLQNNRFTDPNIPCFYGGNTIDCCVKEMRGIKDETLVSCFQIDYNQLGILDLTMPQNIVDESQESYLDRHILSWPIIALCMIRKDASNILNIEYILPQLILQILAKHSITRIDAVRYYSIVSPTLDDSCVNVAIPTRCSKAKGYCDTLLSFFKDDDRDPRNPNYLRITEPTLLKTLLNNHSDYSRIEAELKKNIQYQTSLLPEDSL